jgi:hypothetical protein
VSKPIKSSAARKEPKPERATAAEGKPRLEELQRPASRQVVNIAAHPDVHEPGAAVSNSVETEAPVLAPRPRVSGWFGSSAETSDVPRPPMPVGELQLRAM